MPPRVDRSNWPAGSPGRSRRVLESRLSEELNPKSFFLNRAGEEGIHGQNRISPCVPAGQLRLGLLWRRDQSDAQSPVQKM